MVTSPPASGPASSDWPAALKFAVRDPAELCRLLQLPQRFADAALEAGRAFPLFVPRPYVARMEPGNPRDPLLRQVLPLEEELLPTPQFVHDPVGDAAAERLPGLLQKYACRALMITAGSCAVHCRYCFRRHYPYDRRDNSVNAWDQIIQQIADSPSIEEIVLSGGDPLIRVDAQLAELARKLSNIPHLRRLRIHTRLPIVIPQRVTQSLVGWLTGTRLLPVVVVHANHARELDATVQTALQRLGSAGIQLLNQTVLLRGVNDDLDSLVQLSSRLLECGVIPYYLHQLDRVAGAAHFEVPVSDGVRLIAQMRSRLPGYAVPRYVREQAGAPAKTVLA
jgi:EF-P beta-lysylation protein EpmB